MPLLGGFFVPLYRFFAVLCYAFSVKIAITETVLRVRIALFRRFQHLRIPLFFRFFMIRLLHSIMARLKMTLYVINSLFISFSKPLIRFYIVLRDSSNPIIIAVTESLLRFRISLFGGFFIPFYRFFIIPLYASSVFITETNHELRARA